VSDTKREIQRLTEQLASRDPLLAASVAMLTALSALERWAVCRKCRGSGVVSSPYGLDAEDCDCAAGRKAAP